MTSHGSRRRVPRRQHATATVCSAADRPTGSSSSLGPQASDTYGEDAHERQTGVRQTTATSASLGPGATLLHPHRFEVVGCPGSLNRDDQEKRLTGDHVQGSSYCRSRLVIVDGVDHVSGLVH